MIYDFQNSDFHRVLDKREVELLSAHQQMLYSRAVYARMSDRGFIEADQRLASILPSSSGLFAVMPGFSIQASQEYFLYIGNLQGNKGPLAVMLRNIARVEDLKETASNGFAVRSNVARANKLIEHTAPKSYPTIDNLAKAFEPYLDYSIDGEINLRTPSLRSQLNPDGNVLDNGPVLESVDEMLASKDQFLISNRGWYVVLNCHELGGSVSKMYFEGGTMSSIRYRGACVYNNLEEDYYASVSYHLTQSELEHRLKLLFSQCGWTEDAYRQTSLSPDEFVQYVQALGTAWKPFDFTQADLKPKTRDDDYSYRDEIPQVHGAARRNGEYSVPTSLSAREYSHPQPYMEWSANPSKSVDPVLISPDAPPSFFEDQHHFYGHWNITSNGGNVIYVRGRYDTGEIELSRNRKFEEERHDTHPIILTDGARYVLAQWLRRNRQSYLDEVLSWFRRTRLDPPQALLDAKAAYSPQEPLHD
jgi:hypothetical protein